MLDDVQLCVTNGAKDGGRLSKGGAHHLFQIYSLELKPCKDLQIALLAVKTLGRMPAISNILAQENVRTGD